MTVKQIVAMFIESIGADGLCNLDCEVECGCDKNDLFTCGVIDDDCAVAYKHKDGLFYLTKEVNHE
jgi:hypothetical protein